MKPTWQNEKPSLNEARYVLAPEAALDLVEIWRYVKNKASIEMADLVDLTDEPVKFFPVYSYRAG